MDSCAPWTDHSLQEISKKTILTPHQNGSKIFINHIHEIKRPAAADQETHIYSNAEDDYPVKNLQNKKNKKCITSMDFVSHGRITVYKKIGKNSIVTPHQNGCQIKKDM